MKNTDIAAPDYFHKVVDCQWACPAHTPVPEYIRLIAAGRYSDAYMVNWKSNVFPGILGRTCDRPCEPACRRGRVEEGAGGDLPPEARRRRQQGRHPRPPAASRRARRTASASPGRRRARIADRGARSRPARLPTASCSIRTRKAGGMIRTPDPELPPAGSGASTRKSATSSTSASNSAAASASTA